MVETVAIYEKNVFINCPFDDEYIPILHAITFILLFLGFTPRSGLETDDSGQERLEKILKIIEDCKYGIHDISRVEFSGTADDPLPRYNMPFECGLFFGARAFGSKPQKAKKILVLDSVEHRSKATMSDIAGKDSGIHSGDPMKVIACIRKFFKDRPGVKRPPGDDTLRNIYKGFQNKLPSLLKSAQVTPEEIGQISYWVDFVEIANDYLANNSPFESVSEDEIKVIA